MTLWSQFPPSALDSSNRTQVMRLGSKGLHQIVCSGFIASQWWNQSIFRAVLVINYSSLCGVLWCSLARVWRALWAEGGQSFIIDTSCEQDHRVLVWWVTGSQCPEMKQCLPWLGDALWEISRTFPKGSKACVAVIGMFYFISWSWWLWWALGLLGNLLWGAG